MVHSPPISPDNLGLGSPELSQDPPYTGGRAISLEMKPAIEEIRDVGGVHPDDGGLILQGIEQGFHGPELMGQLLNRPADQTMNR